MEALYSKLYDKYTKLKVSFLTAADELIDDLRNENNKLREKIDELRGEVASMRSAKDEQHMENQRLLLEENQKSDKEHEEHEPVRWHWEIFPTSQQEDYAFCTHSLVSYAIGSESDRPMDVY